MSGISVVVVLCQINGTADGSIEEKAVTCDTNVSGGLQHHVFDESAVGVFNPGIGEVQGIKVLVNICIDSLPHWLVADLIDELIDFISGLFQKRTSPFDCKNRLLAWMYLIIATPIDFFNLRQSQFEQS